MASIQNLRLEIVENGVAAAALVTYDLIGNSQDLLQQSRFTEVVELVGVDEGVGEPGKDKLIPGVRFEGLAIFPLDTPARSRLLALPSSALDEDPSSDLIALPKEDEIRARVTLTRMPLVIAESNVVRRGGLLGPVPSIVAVPA